MILLKRKETSKENKITEIIVKREFVIQSAN